MTTLEQTQILSVKVEFFSQKFRTPMQLSSGRIETITEARATVRVKVGCHEGEGRGSIYLSDLWAWPSASLFHKDKDGILRERCRQIASELPHALGAPAHPLELGLRLHHKYCTDVDAIPPLALALCVAPFDAAIHDAAGQAIHASAFSFYRDPVPIPSADAYFSEGVCQAIASTLRPPEETLNGWWILNAQDDLEGELVAAIRDQGFCHFKIKLLGESVREDVARTIAVYRAACQNGASSPRLSLDSNEAYRNEVEVLDYLQLLREEDAHAYDAVDYLEQPTSRDIQRYACDWSEVAALKPVLLDEGLTSIGLLPLAIEQGWSGLALKTCKGHSFTLVAAAWAHERNLLLAMQDLTNPGIAAIHSWLTASHLPVMNGIELNSPQFTPQANESWLPRLESLFIARRGVHEFNPQVIGLGAYL